MALPNGGTVMIWVYWETDKKQGRERFKRKRGKRRDEEDGFDRKEKRV